MQTTPRLTLDYTNMTPFISPDQMDGIIEGVIRAHDTLTKKKGPGNDYLGWLDWADKLIDKDLKPIREAARAVAHESQAFVVIGIGGSYLGARAVIEALKQPFVSPRRVRPSPPEIIWAGHHLSSEYMTCLVEYLANRDFSINVISKSGTTTEPAVAFRILRRLLTHKYGKKGAVSRIIVTTDRAKGALRSLADDEGYRSFTIPDNIGGRFSVLTPVGLLPIAAAGQDIDELVLGARQAAEAYSDPHPFVNPANLYAAFRLLMLGSGKSIEVLSNTNPCMRYFGEWWKQLFGESEGKDGKGLFPACTDLTTDLHSLGQWVQDGPRTVFETFLHAPVRRGISIPTADNDGDGLGYLVGKDVDFVNEMACQGTALAHADGGVPNMSLSLGALDEAHLGELIYFFQKAVGVSGYALGVNPFDQPAVNDYKTNMFALLGKPGAGAEAEAVRKRLLEGDRYLLPEPPEPDAADQAQAGDNDAEADEE